jgi:hypothetical protein
LTPFNAPVIVATVDEATAVVGTWKVAVANPAGTVTDAGGLALELFELRATTIPLGPAMLPRVTVPVEELPPRTVPGDSEIEANDAMLTVRVAD